MSSAPSGRPRRTRARRPRGLLRKLFDLAVAAAVLGLVALIAARFDDGGRQTAGAALVNDGDSLTLGKERVRMRGIDAPEYNQTCAKDGATYPCGRRSREALTRLIAGRTVVCRGSDRDRYGRLLGRCSAGGTDLNREQVRAGWAVAYGDYEDEEAAARAAGIGLWAGDFERPRDWRARQGSLVEVEHRDGFSLWAWLKKIFTPE